MVAVVMLSGGLLLTGGGRRWHPIGGLPVLCD